MTTNSNNPTFLNFHLQHSILFCGATAFLLVIRIRTLYPSPGGKLLP